jgi:hypothetical protein
VAGGVAEAALSWPEAVTALTDKYSRYGVTLIYLPENGGDAVKEMGKFVMFHRQSVGPGFPDKNYTACVMRDSQTAIFRSLSQCTNCNKLKIHTSSISHISDLGFLVLDSPLLYVIIGTTFGAVLSAY